MNKLESTASIRRRISERFGFMQSRITLLDGTFKDGRCTSCAFDVCGYGYVTDFVTYSRDEAYDIRSECHA